MAAEEDDDGVVFFEELLEEANLPADSDDASAASISLFTMDVLSQIMNAV